MRRFSCYAAGWAGVGLLLLRLAAGIAALTRGFTALRTAPSPDAAIPSVIAMASGILLLVGFWTPVAGWLLAAFGFWSAISQPGDPWASILLGTICAGLALLGPGVWSIDFKLFGWKRIDLGNGRS